MTTPPKVLELRWREEVPPPKEFIVTYGLEVKRSRKSQRSTCIDSYADRLPVRYALIDGPGDAIPPQTFAVTPPSHTTVDPFQAAADRVRLDSILKKVAVPFVYSGCRSVFADGKCVEVISIEFNTPHKHETSTEADDVTDESSWGDSRKRKRAAGTLAGVAASPESKSTAAFVNERIYYYGLDTDFYTSDTALTDANKAREYLLQADTMLQAGLEEQDEKFFDLGHLDLPGVSLYDPLNAALEGAGLAMDAEVGDYFDTYRDESESENDYPSSSSSSSNAKCPVMRQAFESTKQPEVDLHAQMARFGARYAEDSSEGDQADGCLSWDEVSDSE